MSRQRMIDCCFWDDSYILTLDPSEKLLFLYLLTNPLTTICGIYEISMKRMAFDTGFDQDTIQRMLGRLEKDNRCIYRNNWMAMRNWIKHQTDAPGVQKGIERQLAKVPPELAEYVQGFNPVVGTLNLTKPNLTKPNLTDPAVKRLVDNYHDAYLAKTKEKPTVSGRWGRAFKTWLRGHSEDDIRKVIAYFFAYSKRTLFGFDKFQTAFDNLLPAALGHAPRAGPAFVGWKCPHCGESNTYTGSRCMRCKKDRDD